MLCNFSTEILDSVYLRFAKDVQRVYLCTDLTAAYWNRLENLALRFSKNEKVVLKYNSLSLVRFSYFVGQLMTNSTICVFKF